MLHKVRRTLWLQLLVLLFASSVSANSPSENCEILAALPESELVLLSVSDGGYDETSRFSGTNYTIAPDQSSVAVEQAGDHQGGKAVAIFDVAQSLPQVRKVIPNVALIRGASWSPDSRKILLQDAEYQGLLYLYDVPTDRLEPLFRSFDPGLKVFQVAWNASSDQVAYVATEAPFQRTEFGSVVALYVLNLMDLSYHVVTSPDEDVQYYFSNFYWTDSDALSYTVCFDNGSCRVQTIDVYGNVNATFEGDYWLVGNHDPNLLIAVNRDSLDDKNYVDIAVLDIHSSNSRTLKRIPVADGDVVPLFSLAPDFSRIAYVDEDGQTRIVGLGERIGDLLVADVKYDPGAWSPDGRLLLFMSEANLYLYDLQQQQNQLIFSAPNESLIRSRSWLCSH